MTPAIPEKGKYTQILCPMPTGGPMAVAGGGVCGGDLYWVWDLTLPVYLGDLRGGAAPGPDEAYAGGWQVVCAEGHTILMPAALTGDDGADEDSADDMRTIRPADLIRLTEVLSALRPGWGVVDLGAVASGVAGEILDEVPADQQLPGGAMTVRNTRQGDEWTLHYGRGTQLRLFTDAQHFDTACDDRPHCTIAEHHAVEDTETGPARMLRKPIQSVDPDDSTMVRYGWCADGTCVNGEDCPDHAAKNAAAQSAQEAAKLVWAMDHRHHDTECEARPNCLIKAHHDTDMERPTT